ncbi:hypothetical protein FIBSPDRAFT_868407 [Athelia psychrophila]|uniref:Uncharacterized protein n=1 Tax=Athelia psychrophila TaxID=1759441 RepID=A0A166D4H0_9AGAM|nr:hypothetical protein FIBSPDRAFT_868407 [Fibularhizoctonia sp. CBS 109695]
MGREGTGRDPDNLTSFDALNIPRVARSSPVLSRATTNAHAMPKSGAPTGNTANAHVAAQQREWAYAYAAGLSLRRNPNHLNFDFDLDA